jgi:urea transporter
VEPCLADAAPEAAPGLPCVETRYAEARPDAAAIIAAKLQGGSMLNLLSENCAGLLRIGALNQARKGSACSNILSRTSYVLEKLVGGNGQGRAW